MQEPIIEELKEKFKDDVEFKKIDVDELDGKSIDKYSIRAVPTLVIEKDGKIFAVYIGVQKIDTLEKKIKEALESK